METDVKFFQLSSSTIGGDWTDDEEPTWVASTCHSQIHDIYLEVMETQDRLGPIIVSWLPDLMNKVQE